MNKIETHTIDIFLLKMIRIVASTIVERPMLTRNGEKPSRQRYVQNHITGLPYMMQCFRNAIVSVSRESKWVKLALMRNGVPIEIFSLIKPYLIMKNAQDFYPIVSYDQCVPHRKYLLIESKLYRMGLANETTLHDIRKYIMHLDDFKEGAQRNSWDLKQFHIYSRRTDFLKYVLFLLRGVVRDEYETEIMMRYWF